MNKIADTMDLPQVSIELGSPFARIRARGKFRDQDALDFIPTPESAHFYIDTPNFDGPLDLLLHLIRKHSMDIFDIPIGMITEKYLEALDEMQTLNLDVAGEFLLMAATLAEIKSKMLLPKEEQINEEAEEEGQDPREELVKRLLEYKSFKEASIDLLNRPQLGRDVFMHPAPDEEPLEILESDEIAQIEIFELIEALAKALKKADGHTLHTVMRDRISVSTRLHELILFAQIRAHFSFYDVLRYFVVYEKIDVIVTFLAILEMSRLKLIKIENIAKEDLLMRISKENFYLKHKEILENLEGMRRIDYE
jgi:segregation and condensation protein A